MPAAGAAQDGDAQARGAHPANERSSTSSAGRARVEAAAARRVREVHLGRAEQQRVDRVEVEPGRLEHRAERLSVVGRRDWRASAGRAPRARRHPPRRRGRRDRRRAPRRSCARSPRRRSRATGGSGQLPTALMTRCTSKPSSCSLCSAVSTTRAATCTPPGEARGRRQQQRQRSRLDAGPLGHRRDQRGRRRGARLQAQDGDLRVLLPGEVVVQVLGADQRAPGPAGHREVPVAVELPARVLRRQAGGGRMVGAHRQAGHPALTDHHGRDAHAAQPAHRDLGEEAPRLAARREPRSPQSTRRAPPGSVVTATRVACASATSCSTSASARSFRDSVTTGPPGSGSRRGAAPARRRTSGRSGPRAARR